MTAPQVASQIGSGTLPYTYGILPASQRGNESEGQGVRVGQQVMIGNPEDIVAVDFCAMSGVSVSPNTVVEIVSPEKLDAIGVPRTRAIEIRNATLNSVVFVGHLNDLGHLLQEGYVLGNTSAAYGPTLRLPLLHNMRLYAVAVAGTNPSIRMIFY